MRDPERISVILAKLHILWNMNPDMRLGQLISNVIRDPALYYIEDQQLIKIMEEYYKEDR
jgi:hypothetical protein